MSVSNGLIINPVDALEVAGVLGTSGDLADVCTSSYVNIWAKYKPVKYTTKDTTGQLNSDKTWKSSASWWKGYDLKCGINVSSYSDLITMLTAWMGKSSYAWSDFWAYNPPTGGTYPYRLTDFNYYKHKSSNPDNDKPFPTYNMPTDIIRYYFDSQYTIGSSASIYSRTENNDYLLALDDIRVPQGAGNLDLASMYFSVAFIYNYSSSASNRLYAFQSTYWTFDELPDDPTKDGSYGYGIRMTPTFSPYSLQYNGDYLAFPFLSSERLWDTGVYTGTVTGNPIFLQNRSSYGGLFVPLPYAGKVITVSMQTASISLSLTVARTASGTLRYTLTAYNETTSQVYLPQSYLTYDTWVYPEDSQGSYDYQDGTEWTGTWGTGETAIAASGSVTLTKTINFTEYSNYGGYVTTVIRSSAGYISGTSYNFAYSV